MGSWKKISVNLYVQKNLVKSETLCVSVCVSHAFNLNIQEVEAGGSLSLKPACLHDKFQTS